MKPLAEQTGYVRCDGCEALVINGVACHETGCPEAWREPQECDWCGSTFTPEERGQSCCCHSCAVSYSGASCDCEERRPPDWQETLADEYGSDA